MTASVAGRIARLRRDFDRSFAEPVRRHDEEHVELLAIRAGGRRYALRLAQSAGLHPDRPVTPLPGPLPALLGLAGFAGTVVPIYDLAALLGHPIGEKPRWLVLAAGLPALGLAFHQLDGHVRVAAEAIVGEQAGGGVAVDGGRGGAGAERWSWAGPARRPGSEPVLQPAAPGTPGTRPTLVR